MNIIPVQTMERQVRFYPVSADELLQIRQVSRRPGDGFEVWAMSGREPGVDHAGHIATRDGVPVMELPPRKGRGFAAEVEKARSLTRSDDVVALLRLMRGRRLRRVLPAGDGVEAEVQLGTFELRPVDEKKRTEYSAEFVFLVGGEEKRYFQLQRSTDRQVVDAVVASMS